MSSSRKKSRKRSVGSRKKNPSGER